MTKLMKSHTKGANWPLLLRLRDMEELTKILKHYDIGDSKLIDYKDHSYDPDMWSHTFKANDLSYVLVEVEVVNDDLQDDEYNRLEEDLGIARTKLKLVMPRLEEMQTLHNKSGIGVDGHRGILNLNDAMELWGSQEKAQASRYFPPVSEDEMPDLKLKEYKNPDGLSSDTTWVLFELN